MEDLWAKFSGNEDRNFLSDARNHFQQRFWEMYLWVALEEKGIQPRKTSSAGPEFFVELDGGRFWLEAISPTTGVSADAVPDQPHGEFREVPVEKILMRYTAAMSDKLKKLATDLCKERVSPLDGYILALNSGALPLSARAGGEIPYVVKACFPIGNLSYPIDVITKKLGDPVYSPRHEVLKENSAPIETGVLLNEKYAGFSAVLHSAVDCTSLHCPLGADFDLIRNPLATKTIPFGQFAWARSWQYVDDALRWTRPPA